MAATVRRAAVSGGIVRGGMCGAGVAAATIPPGAVMWTDPTDEASLTHASNAVSAFRSQIGTISFDQSTAGLKPTRVAAGAGPLNNLQHLDFDGGDVLTYLNNICTGQAGEVWFVADADTTTASLAAFCQLALGGSPYNVFYAMTTLLQPACSISDSTDHVFTPTNTYGANTTLIVRIYSTGSAYGFEVNGVTETVVMLTGSDNGFWFGDHATDRCNMGAYTAAPTQGMDGQLGDVVLIDGAVLSTEAANVLRRYLATKYGVTLP